MPLASEGVAAPSSTRRPLVLHLVRHGQTRYNVEQRLQGWCDSELTSDGIAGVRATARHLRGVELVAAYASPSGRTVTTAREILRHHRGVALSTHDGLREFGFGEHEARPESELFARVDPVAMFESVMEGTFPGLPGGEPGADYLGRVAAAFTQIERAHQAGGEVLVVSHGITLMAYLTMIAQPPLRPLANASVSTIELRPGGRRRVVSVGVDPSGQAAEPAEIKLRAARVALEEAASWHRGERCA